MSAAAELDPTSSVLAFYATDLRRRREEAGIAQRALAKDWHMAPSLLNKIEAAKRMPNLEMSEWADDLFGSGDHFTRLFKLVIKYAYPTWFRPYVEFEEASTFIRSFENQLVTGLLQTEDYARAVLNAGRLSHDRVEELIVARMERQRILDRDNRAKLWVVLDENVLRRHPGRPDVMRAQFQRLLDAADDPRTVIQVIPYSVGAHAAMAGPFAALTLDEGPDVLYVDGFVQGQIIVDPADVKAADHAYDLLMATALSPDASVDLIASAAKELSR
ncbi:helix-turn-helix transcriptional regulator [Kitasatospora sp. NPDC093806]|uniref:helix-turn-helix domain-containing protein n=1 Tax=Kitasatospora sp. NPDC093806 TaxID=3155075 RepID=UPI003429F81E